MQRADILSGVVFSYLMKFTHKKGFIDRESFVAQYLALAFFTIGIARTLGVDDLLAALAAGLHFCFFHYPQHLTHIYR